MDITDEDLTLAWDKWNRDLDESRSSCMEVLCGVDHYGVPRGEEACFEQAPKGQYSFLAQVGRRYLVTWVDENVIRTTADVEVSVTKMRADEVMILQFSHRPPLYPRLPRRASVRQRSMELWGELEPRFGAWSPPPNIPTYALSMRDHGGNPYECPCASGTHRSQAYSSSCFMGTGGFEAPELLLDPNIHDLTPTTSAFNSKYTGSSLLPLYFKASGRTETGGFLRPMDSAIKWYGQILASAPKWQYLSFCMRVKNGLLSASGNNQVGWAQCANDGNKWERFKFGYDFTADWENIEANELWNKKVDQNSDLPVWAQPLTITLASNPAYCLDSCSAGPSAAGTCTYKNLCHQDNIVEVYLNLCDASNAGRDSQKVGTNVYPFPFC